MSNHTVGESSNPVLEKISEDLIHLNLTYLLSLRSAAQECPTTAASVFGVSPGLARAVAQADLTQITEMARSPVLRFQIRGRSQDLVESLQCNDAPIDRTRRIARTLASCA